MNIYIVHYKASQDMMEDNFCSNMTKDRWGGNGTVPVSVCSKYEYALV